MVGQHPVGDRVAQRLLEYANGVATDGGDLDPYLRRYRTEHVGESGLWHQLGEGIEVLDRLEPDRVAGGALRTASEVGALPVAVLATMVAHAELQSLTPSSAGRPEHWRPFGLG